MNYYFGLLIFVFLGANAEMFDPYQIGPFTQVTKLHWPFESTGLYKNVEIYAPTAAQGTFPVIYFSHSFAGTITVRSVDAFLIHLASYGYTIIAPWRQTSVNYTVEWIDPTIDYCEANVASALISAGGSAAYVPDFSKMVAIGHSAGNHILVNYFQRKGCRDFLGSILLSPVDGPLEFSTRPGEKLNYDMPTLVAMAGLDPVPGAPTFPACAPTDVSNLRFYNAMSGNRWFINATAYGHTDFFEPGFQDLIGLISFCASDKETDKVVYTNFVGGTCIAFMEALLNSQENCGMMDYVENFSEAPVDVTGMFEVKEGTRCVAKCTHL